jgi:Uma2 family endonuclease
MSREPSVGINVLRVGIMGTETKESPRATSSGIIPYNVSVAQFLKMIDAGVFGPSERVELLGGALSAKMTKNDPHDFATDRLGEKLRILLAPTFAVREEKSVVLGTHWRPEPDLVVAVGPGDRYHRAPTSAEIRLIVEVADSSQSRDRGGKWRGYAAAGIPAYWIVDVSRRVIEVFTAPTGRGKIAKYRENTVYVANDEVPVVIEGREFGKIAVKNILP